VTTLRDKRGRVEAGVDGAGRLAHVFNGILGAVAGVDEHTLGATQMPSHRHVAPIQDLGHSHTYTRTDAVPGTTRLFDSNVTFEHAGGVATSSNTTGIRIMPNDGGAIDFTNATGGGLAHPNVQPTIISQKIVRAC
jgi:microcystin-dependent protein